MGSLVEAAATISPTGKQNSFGSRAYASYILAEKGNQQPRSLSVAFLSPVREHTDMLASAIGELEKTRENMAKVYGPCCDGECIVNARTGDGSLVELATFVAE